MYRFFATPIAFCDFQELMGLAEGEPYEFHLLGGETIRLEADGTFFIDGVQCTGEAYTGVDACT